MPELDLNAGAAQPSHEQPLCGHIMQNASVIGSSNPLLSVTGFDYGAADFRQCCGETGISHLQSIPLAGPASAAIVYKEH